MSVITATRARNEFADVVQRASRKKQRVVLTRRGKKLAAVVSMEDLELLERLIEEEDDRIDREEVRKAKAEPGPNKSWDKLKKELEL